MSQKRIAFLLLDGFALLSTAAAMEPLRAANHLSGAGLYDLLVLSPEGGRVAASLGNGFDAAPLPADPSDLDMVFVVAGGDHLAPRDPRLTDWLRRADRAGVALGGISGGAALLWRAGLMEGRRFTLHWHYREAMRAEAPNALLEQRIYVIDRDRYTCAGGTAPLDMMHAIIARDHGAPFARRIADWFIQTDLRPSDAPQMGRGGPGHAALPAPLRAALELMETHVADPLDVGQLAALAGLSERQLQRLSGQHLGAPLAEVYRNLRLDVARELVRRSALPMGEIAPMAGFATQAHFSDAFRRRFGHNPRAERQNATAEGRA
ncbi:GlxA family transcriptional regulator [Pararhodobacter sp. CCB-MM2]|uniref:GlxA family transcriptional regulator n=1 Tax=Pararhodobacter sp. CCB-MM2 TaxID=1786003 RepID=UPI000833A83F|nr:GlxA family transcriptional regulator [Pararhodobacter sp. CCB-MM2]MCA2012330.1 GlxA family transcriptional regulator [Cereibacter sphaeroides]